MRLVQASNIQGLSNKVGIICVINPDTDARAIFNHFADELQCPSIHYILPMEDHDTFDERKYANMTKYLCDLFDAWADRENPQHQIRYFYRLLSRLTGGKKTKSLAEKVIGDSFAFTIASNGDIAPSDDLRNTFPQLFRTHANVANTSMADFINIPRIRNHNLALRERSEDCVTCCWGQVCDGGDIIGTEAFRYSTKNRFRNKSIYCSAIEDLLTHMTKFILKNGVPFEIISETLNIDQ